MLRKLAVALIAATVLTAPALAQGSAPANPPAKTAAAAPKVTAAKAGLKHARVTHSRRLTHRVKHASRVKHAKHVKLAKYMKTKHATHVKPVTKAKHHKVAEVTKKATNGATSMRASVATQPAATVANKPVKHTIKATHRAKHVRLARRSTTHARSDAHAARKSVN
jgi:hypothetical protein